VSARIFGSGERTAVYEVDDTELAIGSTLGGPKGAIIIKASGAIEKFYSSDLGATLMAGISIQFWDGPTGAARIKSGGKFRIYPDAQEYTYWIDDGVTVRETVFVLNRRIDGTVVDPLTAYLVVEIRNDAAAVRELHSLMGAMLRGDTKRDIRARYDRAGNAVLGWNHSHPNAARVVASSRKPESFEVTADHGKLNRSHFAGGLSNRVAWDCAEPIGLLHHRHRLAPGARRRFWFTLAASTEGVRGARKAYRNAPPAARALAQTRQHFSQALSRAIVVTPDAIVNRGVLWAKANMLRTQLFAPTGWCFVNDPTRSNNSVARDTAMFALGGDYVNPDFSRESMRWYLRHAERSGKIVEYYDVRNGKPSDYGLNVNDDTPLMILGLAHYYIVTGDVAFLRESYPAAKRAADYLLRQRDARGLIWCTATKTGEEGIVGWRNIIEDYRISGASTEINAECYAAFVAMARLAEELGKKKEALRFGRSAVVLREAINAHLLDPHTGLYYLNIDVDGTPRSNVTVDMLFPILLGVADHQTAARIVSRLSVPSFWTEAGIRTVPRDDIEYSPTRSWGLLGGVWVGMTFFYALAAAKFNPAFMAYALRISFEHYSTDPGRNNTVPGQFSEWLHGETLANQGMMLSPWYPPRYLWAAVEGACGLGIRERRISCSPRLPPQWKWLGVRNLVLRGKPLTWFIARIPEPTLYATFDCSSEFTLQTYDADITPMLRLEHGVTEIALRRGRNYIIFIGNTATHTIITPVRFARKLAGRYRVRYFTSLLGEWMTHGEMEGSEIERGLAVDIDALGFCVIDLQRVK
jgi:Bacterial alpha-L-rhamnosidase 6 hairpin glycosidase domain